MEKRFAMEVSVPGYRIESLIGEGGASRVYRAFREGEEAPCALKVFLSTEVQHPAFRRRLVREMKITRRLDHPGIVRHTDQYFDPERGLFALVMELVEGENLRARLDRGILEPREAVEIVRDVADILVSVHGAGVAHLDLKPENIMLEPGGAVRLTDFGVAQGVFGSMAQDGLRTQAIRGTVYYMAPEQFDATVPADHRADLYALGVILHEMVTGQRPVAGFPALDGLEAAVPLDDLKSLIAKLIRLEADQRYQTALDVVNRLKGLARPVGGTAAVGGDSLGRRGAAWAGAGGGRAPAGSWQPDPAGGNPGPGPSGAQGRPAGVVPAASRKASPAATPTPAPFVSPFLAHRPGRPAPPPTLTPAGDPAPRGPARPPGTAPPPSPAMLARPAGPAPARGRAPAAPSSPVRAPAMAAPVSPSRGPGPPIPWTERMKARVMIWLDPRRDRKLDRARQRAALDGMLNKLWESPWPIFAGLILVGLLSFVGWTYFAFNGFLQRTVHDREGGPRPSVDGPRMDRP